MRITLSMRDTAREEDRSYGHLYSSPVEQLEAIPEPQDYFEDFRPHHTSDEQAQLAPINTEDDDGSRR